jgi:hypothetical protein
MVGELDDQIDRQRVSDDENWGEDDDKYDIKGIGKSEMQKRRDKLARNRSKKEKKEKKDE